MTIPSILFLAATVMLAGCGRPSPVTSNVRPIGEMVPSLVEAGDIVLRAGKGRWSAYFRDMSQRERRFSHVGVVATNESGLVVVRASADDITGLGTFRAEPFADFIAGHDDIAVFRVRAEQASRRAIAAVCIGKIGTPFDMRFDLSNQDNVYCTELVWLSVNSVMGSAMIQPTTVKGREIVTVDECYLGTWAVKVYDSKQNAEPGGGEVRLSAARPAAPHR